jgi:hypothetical protein
MGALKAGCSWVIDKVSTLNVGKCAIDRNYTAMRTHVRWSVHLSALLIT